MNSIEIAKKLIEENDKDIEDFRRAEKIIQERIAEYQHTIENYEFLIEAKKRTLAKAEKDLQCKRDQKKEYLVDNLALKMFVANGGGLDMLD